jgi:uncharacterized membrane protein
MNKQLSLKIIFGISIAGMLFSGYLSYIELVRNTCALGGGCTSVIGLPSCVYGFVMYAALFGVSLAGLLAGK